MRCYASRMRCSPSEHQQESVHTSKPPFLPLSLFLSDQTDPFNREPLTADMLKPHDELREKIERCMETTTFLNKLYKLFRYLLILL